MRISREDHSRQRHQQDVNKEKQLGLGVGRECMNGRKDPGSERWWPDQEGLVNHYNDFGFTVSKRKVF